MAGFPRGQCIFRLHQAYSAAVGHQTEIGRGDRRIDRHTAGTELHGVSDESAGEVAHQRRQEDRPVYQRIHGDGFPDSDEPLPGGLPV